MHIRESTDSSAGHWTNIPPLYGLQVHFPAHKILPLNHILNHLNLVHSHTYPLFKICILIVVPCTTGFPKCLFPTSTVYDIPGGKGGRCVEVTTLPPSCVDCQEIWEP